jgi:hypothetical protein
MMLSTASLASGNAKTTIITIASRNESRGLSSARMVIVGIGVVPRQMSHVEP